MGAAEKLTLENMGIAFGILFLGGTDRGVPYETGGTCSPNIYEGGHPW